MAQRYTQEKIGEKTLNLPVKLYKYVKYVYYADYISNTFFFFLVILYLCMII